MSNDGILVATIRPPEYWDIQEHYPAGLTPEAMRSIHRDRGFAFIPHNREPIDGDVTYGDTSIALDYIKAEWTDWNVEAVDLSLLDPFQLVLYLSPR